MSCFFGHGPPCEGPPLPKTTLCGIPQLYCVVCRCCRVVSCRVVSCRVVSCGVSVRCGVQNFRGCVQDLGAPPLTPPPPDPSAGPPKISLFFSSPATNTFCLPLLGVVSLNFGGVIEGRDPQMCTFGVLGLSCEVPAAPKPPGLRFRHKTV